jgi:UPF0042 nucleotide-binding protein
MKRARPRVRRPPARFVILTGLSGAGKSQAIRALEDLGYFCVDNLPIALIPTLADLTRREGIQQVAIVVDVREGGFLDDFAKVFRRLRGMHDLDAALIFLEASDEALMRRFSETRRPHPLGREKPVAESIKRERSRLASIRKLADQIVDTSQLTVHELRQAFMDFSRGRTRRARLVITIVSFGYKFGIPSDADLLLDVRFLPNPHFVSGLRARSGRDQVVVDYMMRHALTRQLLDKTLDFLRFLVPHYMAEGKSYLTLGIGCTGGRHRSVMVAEALKRGLTGLGEGVSVRTRHRDISQPSGHDRRRLPRRANGAAP